MGTKLNTVVIGGGVVGLSLALELQTRGHKVTVLDKGALGFGCSYGNAGWITPCFAMPLPQPGLFWKSIGWLLDPESPLYIKPEANWLLARWLWSFMCSMNESKMRQSVEVLAEISKYSFEFYKKLAERSGNSFGFETRGLLMVSGTDGGVKDAVTEMNLMAERGIRGRQVTGDEALSLEPSLRPGLKGGVYFPDEAHAEPLKVVQAIAKEFIAAGGATLQRCEVFDFEFDGGRISRLLTTAGEFEPELVVLAAGTWSRAIADRLNVRVPILGGKGYSLILDDFSEKPKIPIMILEKKIAVTPRADSLRIAGTLELVDQDDGITPRRVAAIERGAREFLRLPTDLKVSEVWRGLRPCTPDGVPLIGFSQKWENLFYCTGHQMLGLQSAPGSARLAGDLILGKTSIVNAEPFSPRRYE